MKVVTFKLEEEIYEWLENQAMEKKLSKSEIIRRALRRYIDDSKEKPYITRRIRVY